jgi:hypothetical protein
VKRCLFLLTILAGLLLAKPAGQYTGTWASDGGINSGKVTVTIGESGDSQFNFTYQDQVVKPKKVTAKVSDDQVDFICDVDLEGLRISTIFHGMVNGKALAGKYRTTSVDDGSELDSGIWQVTLQ